MAYSDHFKLTDDLVAHLDPILLGLNDPFIESRYTGFLSLSAVTVYELAIKEIFREFAKRKHKVLEHFTVLYFERINGRIKVPDIKREYVKKYGTQYIARFEKQLESCEHRFLKDQGVSVSTAYGNLVTWRNGFAHEGQLPGNATYGEARKSYELGKEVIHCLARAMRR